MKIYCDRLPRLAAQACSILTGVLIVAALAALSGCGGGGGGGGSSSGGGGGGGSSTSQVFSGTATDTTTNTPAIGYTVRFDGSGPTTTTTSTGTFSLTVPASDITGSDTLSLLNSIGNVVDTVQITQETNGQSGISLTFGPPTPPPLVIHS
jgi:hypothetical protein